jgi:diaminopimelate epimerase
MRVSARHAASPGLEAWQLQSVSAFLDRAQVGLATYRSDHRFLAPAFMSPALIPYAKMNGIGNSILVVDLRQADRALTGADARALGAMPEFRFDQLMAIEAPRRVGTDAFIDIFNIDGSRAGACGNGTRCVAWVMLRDDPRTALTLETAGGLLASRRLGERLFSVDMGKPRFGWRDIPLARAVDDTRSVSLPDVPPISGADLSRFSAVSMGNPHAVFFVPDAAAVDLDKAGPPIETHPLFPDRANVSFATVTDRTHIVLRTWERGAGATLACGSAACATLVAAVRSGATEREARVSQRGGDLVISWDETNHVTMTGDVALEHEGVLPPLLSSPAP